jgi:hypothetical protein
MGLFFQFFGFMFRKSSDSARSVWSHVYLRKSLHFSPRVSYHFLSPSTYTRCVCVCFDVAKAFHLVHDGDHRPAPKTRVTHSHRFRHVQLTEHFTFVHGFCPEIKLSLIKPCGNPGKPFLPWQPGLTPAGIQLAQSRTRPTTSSSRQVKWIEQLRNKPQTPQTWQIWSWFDEGKGYDCLDIIIINIQ